MRSLAAFDPEEWLSPEVARGPDERARLGYAYKTDSPTLQKWTDPIPDGRRPRDEDPRGILLRRHPLAMLRDTPDLWDLAGELMDGVTNELTREDRHTRSNAEWVLVLTWQAAAARRQEREIRQGVKDGE
jgi:hypothetical protein